MDVYSILVPVVIVAAAVPAFAVPVLPLMTAIRPSQVASLTAVRVTCGR